MPEELFETLASEGTKDFAGVLGCPELESPVVSGLELGQLDEILFNKAGSTV